MAEDAGRVALVAGSNGLVGSKLLPILLAAPEFGRIHALTRRALLVDSPRLANRVVRFDAPLEAQLKGLQCSDAFCCLGTTMRTAGSQAAFRAVDHDLVIQFARLAHGAGAERFILVSSVGANAAAKSFYLRVKGETEKSLEALRFRSLNILQPSMLLGSRRELRLLEVVAQPAMLIVNPLLIGKWSRYRAIGAETVAAAMYGTVRSQRKGVYRYTYDELRKLAANVQT
ncbi:MAG TPA: oxidoreductase [Steroidobacteraceae bacterium]|jgi:uncharacterized protein YbjT (DUF2867 family)|nr:oxidoreductase [Steroidobacteraceae bacterium]